MSPQMIQQLEWYTICPILIYPFLVNFSSQMNPNILKPGSSSRSHWNELRSVRWLLWSCSGGPSGATEGTQQWGNALKIMQFEKRTTGKGNSVFFKFFLAFNLHLDTNNGSSHMYFNKNSQDESMFPLWC